MTAVKGALRLETTGERLPFTFNPTSVVLHKSATWSGTPAPRQQGSPTPQFVGCRAGHRHVAPCCSTRGRAGRDVASAVVDRLTALDLPAAGPGSEPQPPLVRLEWGRSAGVLCFVKEVTRRTCCSTTRAPRCGRPST